MKSVKTKVISTIALAILLTSMMVIVGTQLVNAQLPDRGVYDTFAYISANPSPIGAGQTALITYRVDQPAAGATANSGHFNGTSVTITRPDNTTEIKSNLNMDSTSSGWFLYTPTQVGTYYFQMHFPQQGPYEVATGGGFFGAPPGIYTYAADDSAMVPLIVQQEEIAPYDRSPPLPTGYWTRPINAENKGWWQVADNWLMKRYDQTSRGFAGTPAFAPYTSGPQSAHILWKKPIIPGGIVGGQYGDTSFYTGVSYEQHFEAMIINGKIFYGEHGLTSSNPIFGTRFIDLYTGEDYPNMYMEDINIAFAQTVNTDNPNEHGILPYLVNEVSTGFFGGGETSWEFYEILPDMQIEPQLRFTLSGMAGLTGYTTIGPRGEILSFNMGGNDTHNWISMFNSTRAVLGLSFSGIETWSPSGTINASRSLDQSPGAAPEGREAAEAKSHSPFMGIEWNVTVPRIEGFEGLGERLVNYEEGWLLATTRDDSGYPWVYQDVGYNIGRMVKDSAGAYPQYMSQTFAANRTQIHDIHDRVSNNLLQDTYVRYDEGEEVWYGFDMATGQQKWATEPLNNAWALFTRIYQLAYDKMITSGFDGVVRAWNLDTGELEWEYNKGSAGFENAYGTYPEYAGLTVADRKVYSTADEHSSDGVLWRGASMWAIDIDSGELVWKVNGMYRHPIVADGICVALNSYDGSLYAFGRGPSKTTVSGPQTVVPEGTGVMITGSVTDQTPASKDTPAISDESMGQWMEYLHMQKVCPDNATGVEVMLQAVAPNGDIIDIGTTTTDMSGKFGVMFNPDMQGTYQIIATFEGSESYGASYDTTYIGVGTTPAASPTSPPTTTEPPTTTVPPTTAPPTETAPPTVSPPSEPTGSEMYIIAAVAVVIIVAAAAAAVFLRRRK